MVNKEPEDFGEVYHTYYPSVFLYVRKRVQSQHEAEDLTSEIFEAAHHYYPSYEPEKSALATWLYVIAGSRLKNYYRKNRPACADISELSEFLPCAESGIESIETAEQAQTLRDLLADALQQLSERSRKIVVMKYLLNRPTEEIAKEVGTTNGNVRVLLLRALRQMEKYLGSSGVNWEEFTNG